jgi:hypothetical protein
MVEKQNKWRQLGNAVSELEFITSLFSWIFNFLSRIAEPLMTLAVIRIASREILPAGKKKTWFSLGWGGNLEGDGSASPSGSGRDPGIASPHGGE